MDSTRERLLAVWRRTLSLAWPISIEQAFNTLMRTTDVIVVGALSPAAVAAVGIADLYARLPMRLGFGFGAGAIALSSQDTGRGAAASRDEAVSQAMLMGLLVGVPFVVGGLLFSEFVIAVLGATATVAALGGLYLTIVWAASPVRIVGIVAARALQGTGDTRTPMAVRIVSNLLNITGTVSLGLGVGPVPQLGVLGVALATALARVVETGGFLLFILAGRAEFSLARPSSPTVARQLVAVSLPNVAEGLASTVANFPFNAILLGFGTEVNAAFHIGRRMYQQITGPLYRAYSTVASIVVGQRLGEGDPAGARFDGIAIVALAALTTGLGGAFVYVFADQLVRVFTRDPATARYAADFARVFGAVMAFYGVCFPFSGALRGAGDTTTPFLGRLTGEFGFTLGFSYLVGVVLGVGLPAVFAGLVLTYVSWSVVVGYGFLRGGWAERAASMMDERDESVSGE